MWYYYEFGSTYKQPWYYCQKCENNTHFSNYEPTRSMCHTCIMSEEIDQNQFEQYRRWHGEQI